MVRPNAVFLRRVLASALIASCALPAVAAMKMRPVEWSVGADRFSGMLVYDDAGPAERPGLVMVPNWMGVSDDAVALARQVASDDYVVLVADVYGKGVRPKDDAQAREQVMKAYGDGGATLRKRAAAAVDALKSQAGSAPLDATRIGAFGFCFGGSVALELARSGADLSGVVSLHGGLETHLPTDGNRVRASVLVLNGADDKAVTDAHIDAFKKEMDTAGADWQFVDFSGARHCFAQPEDANDNPANNCQYNERAATRAFGMLHDFFRERFSAK